MAGIDERQNRIITLVIGGLVALGGVTAFLAYLDNRKHMKVKEEIIALDKEIKELQLAGLKKKA